MSSKKSWPLQQVSDPYGDVATATIEKDDVGLYDTAVKTPKRKVTPDEKFVKYWLTSKSYCELATLLGITISAAQARATRLRKAGIKLPMFERLPRKRKEVDVTGLNDLIERNQNE